MWKSMWLQSLLYLKPFVFLSKYITFTYTSYIKAELELKIRPEE